MFEFIRRHASVLAAMLLAWMTWSDLDAGDGEKTAAGKAKPEGIAAEFLAVRDPDQERMALRDPCGIIDLERPTPTKPTAKPSGRTSAATSGASDLFATLPQREPAEVLDAWIDALGARGASLVGELQTWDPLGVRRLATKPVESAPVLPPARFSLYLNATLDMAEGGTASISGKTYAVGDALTGFDVHSPPVLTSVSGTTAVVSWRDQVLLLDLLSVPAVHIGGPPLGSNPNGASSGTSSGGNEASSGPRPRNGSSASPAKGSGPKPRIKRGGK